MKLPFKKLRAAILITAERTVLQTELFILTLLWSSLGGWEMNEIAGAGAIA